MTMIQAPIDTPPIATDEIVITAARAPEQASDSAASVIVVEKQRIERLGEPLLPALLRLIPSTAVSTSGPAGSLTQVRIRGAEASHTLLFVDGIRANDPASINEPHWELLNADLRRGSRWSAARNRRCGARRRSAAGSQLTALEAPPRPRSSVKRGRSASGACPPRAASS